VTKDGPENYDDKKYVCVCMLQKWAPDMGRLHTVQSTHGDSKCIKKSVHLILETLLFLSSHKQHTEP